MISRVIPKEASAPIPGPGMTCPCPARLFKHLLGLASGLLLPQVPASQLLVQVSPRLPLLLYLKAVRLDMFRLSGHVLHGMQCRNQDVPRAQKVAMEPLHGFLCQFGIMPFMGFVLLVAFGIMPIQATVVLLSGCCPGRMASNILAYWIDGDMDLR